MTYVPNTDTERKEMLEKIGVSSFEELISNIPENLRFKGGLDLPPRLSEYEAFKLLEDYSKKNITADTHTCFTGGGAYDHFIPSIVGSVLQKPEFKTAYTPYQAEVSQGTLQVMYEYQTMICELTGMEVSNASLYDAASSVAEACFMSNAHNRKKKFLVAGRMNPNYRRVVDTITAGRGYEIENYIREDGTADLEALDAAMTGEVSGLIVQAPNFYGTIDDVHALEKIAHKYPKTLFIVIVNPISLGMLEAPGNYNADVVIGEGQVLGIPLSFGGPYLGIFACKKEFVRKIPGRLAGITEDADGKRSYVLTLQTREQQIKREKATSNICTNQGLFMLASTVYMAAMGPQGIKEVAEQCYSRAHYLAEKISEIPGFGLVVDKPFFNEFLVKTPVEPTKIIKAAEERGIIAGIDTLRYGGKVEGLLVAVTEKRSKEEMDNYVEFLKEFAG